MTPFVLYEGKHFIWGLLAEVISRNRSVDGICRSYLSQGDHYYPQLVPLTSSVTKKTKKDL